MNGRQPYYFFDHGRPALAKTFSFSSKILAKRQDSERTGFVNVLRIRINKKDCRRANRRLGRIIQREYKELNQEAVFRVVWNWAGKTLSPGAPFNRSNFFMPNFIQSFAFPSPLLTAPGSPRMGKCTCPLLTSVCITNKKTKLAVYDKVLNILDCNRKFVI